MQIATLPSPELVELLLIHNGARRKELGVEIVQIVAR